MRRRAPRFERPVRPLLNRKSLCIAAGSAAAMDLSSFRSLHPDLCDAGRLRALGARGVPEGARELRPEALDTVSVAGPKDPNTLPAILKAGPEAVAWYVSFRLDPDRWGVCLREGGLRALKEEYHRIIWRDLGKYADRPIDDVAERIEYTLVLDYLLTHSRFHYLVDVIAAEREAGDGRPRYLPYLEWRAATAQKPPATPGDIVNLEEALANLEAFKSFINPAYCDAIARLVQGRLDERNVQEWQAFFVGARWGTEIANAISRQPVGFRDFTKFLNRTTSVGSTNYVRVKYSYNPETYTNALKALSFRIDGAEPPKDLSHATNPFTAEPPPYRMFLVP